MSASLKLKFDGHFFGVGILVVLGYLAWDTVGAWGSFHLSSLWEA
jgi:hypothetical protein